VNVVYPVFAEPERFSKLIVLIEWQELRLKLEEDLRKKAAQRQAADGTERSSGNERSGDRSHNRSADTHRSADKDRSLVQLCVHIHPPARRDYVKPYMCTCAQAPSSCSQATP
jgi:hypothetical protein